MSRNEILSHEGMIYIAKKHWNGKINAKRNFEKRTGMRHIKLVVLQYF
jgi:hypothetical protein